MFIYLLVMPDIHHSQRERERDLRWTTSHLITHVYIFTCDAWHSSFIEGEGATVNRVIFNYDCIYIFLWCLVFFIHRVRARWTVSHLIMNVFTYFCAAQMLGQRFTITCIREVKGGPGFKETHLYVYYLHRCLCGGAGCGAGLQLLAQDGR